MGKIRKTFLIMIGTILVWSHLPYHYNNEKVAAYATAHAAGGYADKPIIAGGSVDDLSRRQPLLFMKKYRNK